MNFVYVFFGGQKEDLPIISSKNYNETVKRFALFLLSIVVRCVVFDGVIFLPNLEL